MNSQGNHNKRNWWPIWQLSGVVFLPLGILLFCGSALLTTRYVATGSAQPNPVTNQIYAIDNRGHITYVTHAQKQAMELLMYGGSALAAFGGASYLYSQYLKKRSTNI